MLIRQTCKTCGTEERLWWSKERSGQKATIDAVWAAAVAINGNHPDKIRRMMCFANVGSISSSDQRLRLRPTADGKRPAAGGPGSV